MSAFCFVGQDATFRLNHVDVQLGCQSLLRHGHALFCRQMKDLTAQHDRAARQLAGKQLAHAALRRQKLQQLSAQFEEDYGRACLALTTVARNLDFGELNLALGLHAGPAGLLSMAVRWVSGAVSLSIGQGWLHGHHVPL